MGTQPTHLDESGRSRCYLPRVGTYAQASNDVAASSDRKPLWAITCHIPADSSNLVSKNPIFMHQRNQDREAGYNQTYIAAATLFKIMLTVTCAKARAAEAKKTAARDPAELL